MSWRFDTSGTRQNPATDHRLLTEERIQALYQQIQGLQRGEGRTTMQVLAWWRGELRWARNRVMLASDRRDVRLQIERQNRKGKCTVSTNQFDAVSLEAAVRAAERGLEAGERTAMLDYDGFRWTPPLLPYPETPIWSDKTYQVTPEQRGSLARTLTENAEAEAFLSAGFIQMRVGERWSNLDFESQILFDNIADGAWQGTEGKGAERVAREAGYIRHTEAQCAMTVRHPKGVASGWAGLSSYDWTAIDAGALANQALEKCRASLNPVAIEPGRYTVILAPQAVADLVGCRGGMIDWLQYRSLQEDKGGPFSLEHDRALGVGRTKLGLKVIDDRISILQDSMDDMLGVLPALGLRPVTWIDHGILKTLGNLAEARQYALKQLNENVPDLYRPSFRMTGGATSVEEMIATTKRGLLVTRFHDVHPTGDRSLLCRGLTRDGLWLIENGKIAKAAKNMRFTDSPLFMLNQVEQLGVPVPVFRLGDEDLRPAIVPPIKAKDFAFTSMIDAV